MPRDVEFILNVELSESDSAPTPLDTAVDDVITPEQPELPSAAAVPASQLAPELPPSVTENSAFKPPAMQPSGPIAFEAADDTPDEAEPPAKKIGHSAMELEQGTAAVEDPAEPVAASDGAGDGNGGHADTHIPPSEDPGDGDQNEELAKLQQAVRASANRILEALPNEVEAGYALGCVSTAVMLTEGQEAARKFASDSIDALDLPPKDTFKVWRELYAAGDKESLPKARRAAGLASEQPTFLEEEGIIELGGQRSAERLISLVRAGDIEGTALARGMVKTALVTDRAEFFGQLYKTGDDESLDLALKAAKKAKEYAERINAEVHYSRSKYALQDMATTALQNEKPDDALKIMENIEDEGTKAHLHVLLFKQGRTESLQEALSYLEDADEHRTKVLERELAEAGYKPALEVVKQRVEDREKHSKRRIGRRQQSFGLFTRLDELEDLVVLHNTGVKDVGRQVAELVRTDKYPDNYLHYLGRVGLSQEEEAMAAELYEADPSPRNASTLLYRRLDFGLWHTILDDYCSRGQIDTAAQHLKELAARAIDNFAK